MEFYLEPARNIPVLATTEVLVVGGGPSGIAAAMSAAREGAATMLIERFGCFGGMM
ncbi:FAD-dependent oxidoreductase, partial [Escherichia coli]